MLDLTNLRENYNKLLNFMINTKDYKYSSSYIKSIKTEINHLLKMDKPFDSYEDYYLFRADESKSEKVYRYPFKSYITVIMNFDLFGEYPNGERCKHQLFENFWYEELPEDFKQVIKTYELLVDRTVKNKRTCSDEIHEARTFFIEMKEKNISHLSDINEDHIISYFLDENNNPIRGYSCRWRLKRVLDTAGSKIKECQRISFLLPPLKCHRKNIQYLSDTELKKIKETINNTDKLSYMTCAIGNILIYTGLRAVDIAGIKLTNIDWDNETIYIIQSKTSQPLELPLSPIVGNSIYLYLINERPKVNNEYLFVQREKTYKQISANTVRQHVSKIMDEAGIRLNKSDRRGTHIFRHKLATSMLEKNIPTPIISDILGHISPESLETYVSTDLIHLKECALSIENFPIYREEDA